MEKIAYFICENRSWVLSNKASREVMNVDGKRFVEASKVEIDSCRPRVRVIRNLYRISDETSVKLYA